MSIITRAQSRLTNESGRRVLQGIVCLILFLFGLVFWLGRTGGVVFSDKTQVWMLDIGQGDATLIQTKEGKQILIDGGPDQSLLTKVGTLLPPWDRHIDALIVTHPDSDHYAGLIPLMETYKIGAVYTSGDDARNSLWRAFQSVQATYEIKEYRVMSGDQLQFDEVQIEVLSPGDEWAGERNNGSLVLRTIIGNHTLLLMGDAEQEVEEELVSRAGHADVLKVGHHGSITSSIPAFLRSVRPSYALISAGEENRFGHPHPAVLARLRNLGVRMFRTDLDGDVRLLFSNDGLEVNAHPLPF